LTSPLYGQILLPVELTTPAQETDVNISNSKALIDQLGEIKARIADLELQEKELKKAIIEMGTGAHDGDAYRATVVVSDRETLDMEAVREKLSAQFIRVHTSVKQVTSVRVVARTEA
jgi:hypothetical protein